MGQSQSKEQTRRKQRQFGLVFDIHTFQMILARVKCAEGAQSHPSNAWKRKSGNVCPAMVAGFVHTAQLVDPTSESSSW